MKIIFMGTGTSQGVPVIASRNKSLDLKNPRNWRTRTCTHIEIAGHHIQIDAGQEFRIQCLQNKIEWIDWFILTHGHADHILGMDDLRRFCDIIPGNKLDVISSREGMERISQIFPYALHDIPDKPGYPCFSLSEAKPEQELFEGKVLLKTELLPHGPIETLGLVFEAEGKKLAYFSDCKTLTPRAMDMAAKADLLAIDGLRLRDHPSHMSLFTAMGFAKQLEAKQTYIIHTTSEIDYSIWEPKMPENCHLAYDGLSVQI